MGTVVNGDFEWDAQKAATNEVDHGVSFEEAALALQDPASVELDDLVFPDRAVSLCINPMTGVLCVVWTDGAAQRTRIISARKALAHEQRAYYEEGRFR